MQDSEGATIIPDRAQRDFSLAMWRNVKYSSESDSDHRREKPISKDLHDSFPLKVELIERI